MRLMRGRVYYFISIARYNEQRSVIYFLYSRLLILSLSLPLPLFHPLTIYHYAFFNACNPTLIGNKTNQIFIKTLTGRKQAFNFEPENQVLAVKQALQEKEGIQVDQIRLIFSGKQLSDDRTLESYTINAGATIHMVLQLRGGAGEN